MFQNYNYKNYPHSVIASHIVNCKANPSTSRSLSKLPSTNRTFHSNRIYQCSPFQVFTQYHHKAQRGKSNSIPTPRYKEAKPHTATHNEEPTWNNRTRKPNSKAHKRGRHQTQSPAKRAAAAAAAAPYPQLDEHCLTSQTFPACHPFFSPSLFQRLPFPFAIAILLRIVVRTCESR